MSSGYIDLPVEGSSPGAGVSSLNGLSGAISLVAGPHITITPGGSTITIGATGFIASINGDSTAAQTLTTGTAGTDFAITNPGGGSHVFNLPTASASSRGALSSADWITFNTKQPAGSYITALTGDVSAAGPGIVAATLATVNATPGTYAYATVTVNAKGLVTAATANSTPIGTVTSVALTAPASILNVTGSPITSSGTLALSLVTQAANTVFAGPTSGGSAAPAFRLLVSADIPNNAANTTGTASNITGIVAIANGGTSQTTAAAARSSVGLNIDQRSTFSNTNYTALSTDRYVAQTGTMTAPRTVTLPAASSVNAGQLLIIADESGTVTTTNIITVTAAGGDTINGTASRTIRSAFGEAYLVSNGTNSWYRPVTGIGAGGTGLSTTPIDGQLLIGSTTSNSYVLANLTGSADIGVANGSGSIALSLTNTTISAGSYGSASQTVNFTVDAKGRLTNAVNIPILITASQVSDFTTAAQTAAVINSLGTPSTVKAPSVDSVNTALAGKMTNPMTTLGDIIYGGASGTPTRLGIGTTDQVLAVVAGIPAWINQEIGLYGDSSDGDVSVTGTLPLTNNVYYNTLTISGAGNIITSGYQIFCKTLDLSTAAAGSIKWNGNNGTSATTQVGGGAGAALANAYLGGAQAGTAGTTGTTGAGTQPAAPGNVNPSNGGSAGAGGSGGSGNAGANAGGASRAGGVASINTAYGRYETQFNRAGSQVLAGAPGAAGSAGGGDGTVTGGGGGGSPSGAGVITIYAEKIITTGSTAAGAIQANGGNGGNGGKTSPTGQIGGGGGGGGAGGGYVYLMYNTKTGGTVTNLIQANGGNGGTGGNGAGTGVGGRGGDGGDGGRIRIFNNLLATGSLVTGSAGSAGSAGSGNTGGTGGAGGTAQSSL